MNKMMANTPAEIRQMLDTIGVKSVEDLFSCIPKELIEKNELKLPNALSDVELVRRLAKIASMNTDVNEYACYIGAGAYDAFIPPLTRAITSRQEFLTSYTPYQPEASQGWLQAIFEYQSMICALTGLEGANASLYDGGSALSEAVSISVGVKRKQKICLSDGVNPRYAKVIKTFARYKNFDVVPIPLENGLTQPCALSKDQSKDSACMIFQQPNYFGCIEDAHAISEFAKRHDMHTVISHDPISLGLLCAPVEYEADIVTGEGQQMGNALAFGGPYLGFMAVAKPLIRKMPGRIVGQTVDADQRRCFVLTMQAREQHIRREKASSNICTNQALNALSAAIYMACLGPEGIRTLAKLRYNKAHYLQQALMDHTGFKKLFDADFFMEFAVKTEGDMDRLESRFYQNKIFFGHRLEKDDDSFAGALLIAVTEKRTKEDLDAYVKIAGDQHE